MFAGYTANLGARQTSHARNILHNNYGFCWPAEQGGNVASTRTANAKTAVPGITSTPTEGEYTPVILVNNFPAPRQGLSTIAHTEIDDAMIGAA